MSADPKDPFSRANYRSLIAWPQRIKREAPFLKRVLAELPERSVADLGCGTGEHSRYLHSLGFRAAGIDSSESMIAGAAELASPPELTFTLGDLREADRVLGSRFGGAICLGNTLPFLRTDDELNRAFGAASRLLLRGGRLLLQILNYQALRAKRRRHLPLNFHADGDAQTETIFLRLLDLRDHDEVLFFPTTLRLDPDSETPVELVRSRRVELRGWREPQIRAALERSGFHHVELFGDMEGGAFDPSESDDLVAVATRGPD